MMPNRRTSGLLTGTALAAPEAAGALAELPAATAAYFDAGINYWPLIMGLGVSLLLAMR